MPNFVGMPLASVKNTLLDAGLLLGSVTVMAQPVSQAATGIPAPASVIVAQNPAAGDKIFVGTRVDLQVQ